MTVIAGSYSGTWNALAIGNTAAGFRKNYAYKGRQIQFDAVGEANVDQIFTGLNMTVDFVAQEYDAAAIDTLRWPFASTIGRVNPAGLSMWQAAKPLILTSCLTGVDPQTITFYKTILAPEYEISTEYSHRERPLPMRVIVFPVKYEAGGDYSTPSHPTGCEEIVYFSETNWP